MKQWFKKWRTRKVLKSEKATPTLLPKHVIASTSSIFCDVTQRRLAVVCRRFGTTHHSHFKDHDYLIVEDANDKSRNVGKHLWIYAALRSQKNEEVEVLTCFPQERTRQLYCGGNLMSRNHLACVLTKAFFIKAIGILVLAVREAGKSFYPAEVVAGRSFAKRHSLLTL